MLNFKVGETNKKNVTEKCITDQLHSIKQNFAQRYRPEELIVICAPGPSLLSTISLLLSPVKYNGHEQPTTLRQFVSSEVSTEGTTVSRRRETYQYETAFSSSSADIQQA